MLATFTATLQPLLTLFLCMAIGFALKKCKVLPGNTGSVMAKLEMWVFCPALSFVTMATNCTIDTISTHAVNIFMGRT